MRARSFGLTSVAAWLFMTALGCDSAIIAYQSPFLAASAKAVDFGEQKIGTREERTIYLINSGDYVLELETPEGNLLDGVFGVHLDDTTVRARKDVVASVHFAPVIAQRYETTVLIRNDSANEREFYLAVAGVGINPGPCENVVCSTPRAPECSPDATSRRVFGPSRCVDGECVPSDTFTDVPCGAEGCDPNTSLCRGNPCDGVACTTPPNGCFHASGSCESGTCRYTPNNDGLCNDGNACTEGDHCQEGSCVGVSSTCNTPPSPACVDANTQRVFDAQGTCDAGSGACRYPERDVFCTYGCSPGGCDGNPCDGVSCDRPPNTQCWEPLGACTDGLCEYAMRNGSCDDGNPCTVDDTCTAGTCSGRPKACNTPPVPTCSTEDTRTVYAPQGVCVAGECQYQATVMSCSDQNACTRNDRCVDGACVPGRAIDCQTQNPCSNDSCDPQVGCKHEPLNGVACNAGGDCPMGTCVAGTCMSVPDVTCEAQMDVDICHDIDVPGICTASGDCVVREIPPQFQCTGCNGLCIRCYFIQVCIPISY